MAVERNNKINTRKEKLKKEKKENFRRKISFVKKEFLYRKLEWQDVSTISLTTKRHWVLWTRSILKMVDCIENRISMMEKA